MLITRQELALRRISLDGMYSADQLALRGERFRLAGSVKVSGGAELSGGDIRLHGVVLAGVNVECDRCTTEVELPVKQEFDLLYRPVSAISRDEDIEVSRDELDVGFYAGEGVNLADVIKEQIILSLPMKVLCGPDCRGLCPVCHSDLNHETCHCQQLRNESPFASLLRTGR